MSHELAHEKAADRSLFGFWVYLMTDCILFGTLFATYIALKSHTFGGPSAKEILDVPRALGDTLILLTSSFTSGMAMVFAQMNNKRATLAWFGATFALGFFFLIMEWIELSELVRAGHSWENNAFLSAFFTLLGTHGLHIGAGLIFMAFFMGQLMFQGLTSVVVKRLTCMRMFWNFLDLVWIFIFTLVYLLKGA